MKSESDSVTAVGYVRVGTGDQADSDAGLEAQRRAFESACEARGLHLSRIEEDAGLSGKSLNRPGLRAAIEQIEGGLAGALFVAKLDRLSRSLLDFAALMQRSRNRGWSIVALDLGVDTSTPQGEMMASVMASFAQFERRLIGLRTKEALAVKRSQGVVLGRPRIVTSEVSDRISAMRAAGSSLRQIAAALNSLRIRPPRGGDRWQPNTVRRLLLRLGYSHTNRLASGPDFRYCRSAADQTHSQPSPR
ncbi:MAG: hypothetical protein F2692_06755 [Actinobacteria bacterium]|nr:hypothetical protein [Actinomycetota bacterium]